MTKRCNVCHKEPCKCGIEFIDIEMAAYIDDLKDEITRLERRNKQLRNALVDFQASLNLLRPMLSDALHADLPNLQGGDSEY
jgi:hypothetical protein